MSTIREWIDGLDAELSELVLEMIGVRGTPTDEQIAEVVDMAEDYTIDAMGLEPDVRERLETAIEGLDQRIQAADPRHKFLRMHDGLEVGERLGRFYAEREHEAHQHRALTGTEYAPYPLYVDFDAIGNLMNPDFTAESIGAQYVEFANLGEQPDGEYSECYAHLAIDPQTTTIYLMEPSGSPEKISDDLDGFLARLSAP